MRAIQVFKFQDRVFVPAHLFCPSCGNGLLVFTNYIDRYLQSQEVNCEKCKAAVDWWEITSNSIKENHGGVHIFYALGAQTEVFEVSLLPAQYCTIDLSKHGIPEGRKILQTSYAPQDGNLFPIEVHGNTPEREAVDNKIILFPRPSEPGQVDEPTRVLVGITWLAGHCDPELEQLLVAFDHIYKREPEKAILPANVAVEYGLNALVFRLLTENVSKTNVEHFLRDSATYGHQLNVLMPALTALKQIRPMPDHIRGHLNRLRKLRNQIAHSGRFSDGDVPDDIPVLLCAALFGYHYIGLVGRILDLMAEQKANDGA